jgi:hypothetical protein
MAKLPYTFTVCPDGAEPEPKKWTATTPQLLSMLRDDILRQAIAEAEKQQPVVGTKTWFEDGKMVTQHLYASDISQECVDETAKCVHEWVGLTEEEVDQCHADTADEFQFYQAIEAKLKEKNT